MHGLGTKGEFNDAMSWSEDGIECCIVDSKIVACSFKFWLVDTGSGRDKVAGRLKE